MMLYLGTVPELLLAIILPAAIVWMCVIGVVLLITVKPVFIAVFLALMFESGSVSWSILLWKSRDLLYAMAKFGQDSVSIHAPFKEAFDIKYNKCKSIGIAMYRHAFMNNPNSLFGTNVWYIVLSIDKFPEKYRYCANLWKPSRGQLKLKYTYKRYKKLIEILPYEQAWMLKTEHNHFFSMRG